MLNSAEGAASFADHWSPDRHCGQTYSPRIGAGAIRELPLHEMGARGGRMFKGETCKPSIRFQYPCEILFRLTVPAFEYLLQFS